MRHVNAGCRVTAWRSQRYAFPAPSAPTHMKLSIVLPARNESVGLGKTLPRLRELFPDAEVIVVDDGSTDGTPEVALANGCKALRTPYGMGNGAAIKRGARAATGDVIVFMDADGQHDPTHIAALLDRIDAGFDMAVGARDATGQASLHRGFANALYNRLASAMTGHRIADLTSGFRAVRAAHDPQAKFANAHLTPLFVET
jgi:glycosyltransferase involved in cell wall biosynthesis